MEDTTRTREENWAMCSTLGWSWQEAKEITDEDDRKFILSKVGMIIQQAQAAQAARQAQEEDN